MRDLCSARWLVAIGCLACFGCSSEEKAAEQKEKVTIGWLAKGSMNTFFDLSRHAAQLAAQDLASASGREVEIVLLDSPETTPEAQVAAAQAGIDMGISALNVSVLDPAMMTPVIDSAVDTGVPVLTFDSDAPDSKRSSFYGISNLEGATTAANLLASLMGESGKVAIMTAAGTMPGTLSTSQTYLDRMSGFLDTIAGYPDIEVVSTTTCSKTDETEKAGCTLNLEELMAEHPDVTGFYLSRGRVLREAELETLAPTWSAAVKAGTVKVVGFDAPEDAIHSVENGLVHALITQDYFGWGYDVVNLSFDVVAYGRQLEPFTDSQFDVVCANNVAQLRSMWDAQDFRSTLDHCDLLP